MALKFFVPKFIKIEDRIAGLTFMQLFALVIAFLLSFFIFKINQFLGLISVLISFGSAFVLTFVYVNGKPFLYVLPKFFDSIFRNNRFTWIPVKKISYKEIALPPEITEEAEVPTIKPKQQPPAETKTEIILEYPESKIKEKLTISLEEPIAPQVEKINHLIHKHLINPRNPYRFFPYVKLFKTLK